MIFSQGGWISSGGDDRRIFFRFEIFDSGIFWVGKFGKYSFVWLDLSGDLSRDFFGYSKQSEYLFHGSAFDHKFAERLFCNCQASLQPENDSKDGKGIPDKGASKKKSSKQKPPKKTKPSTVSAGNEWSVKQIIGGLLGVFSLIIVCAAVVQRRSSTTSHTGENGHVKYVVFINSLKMCGRINPLIPRSNQYVNSPYSFNTLSSRQVMRIKKIINYGILS